MKEKKLHLEFLRFAAILLVIFNHTGEGGYLYFTTIQHSPWYFMSFLSSVLCKVAVPLFWMVSGALLIDKEESIAQLYKKRFLRIFSVLLIFSFAYYLYSAKGNPDFSFSPVYFAKLFYSSDLAPAFWFLYSYLGMLILLPLLRRLAKNLSNQEYIYFFCVMLLLRGFLPVFEYVFFADSINLNPSLIANFFSYDVVFFLAGYFFEKRIPESELSWKAAVVLLIAGLSVVSFIMAGTQLWLNAGGRMQDANAERFYAGLLLVPSAALFFCARLAFRHVRSDGAFAKLVVCLGSVSFPVMLLEHFVRSESGFVYTFLRSFLPQYPACILWVLFIYLVCGLAGWIFLRLKKKFSEFYSKKEKLP